LPEIQNPNQPGGGPDSRTLLIYSVVFLAIFLGLQFYRSKYAPKPAEEAHKNLSAATENGAAPQPGMNYQQTAPAAGGSPSTPAAPAVEAASQSSTVIDSELYRVTFSNRGGQVTSWILKKYKDEDGHPLDLVNSKAAAKFGYPFSLYTYDRGLMGRLDSAMYVPSATGTLTAPASVTFKYSAGGVTATKTFTFGNDYVVKADVDVTQNGAPVTALLDWPSGFGDQVTLPQFASGQIDEETGPKQGFHLTGGPNIEQVPPKKVSGGESVQGPLDYAGVSDLYFASIFLPPDPSDAIMVTQNNSLEIPRNLKKPKDSPMEKAPVLGAAVGSSTGVLHTRIFVGPKALDVLGAVHTADNQNLQGIVRFGWWGWIAKPMFLVLRFFYDHGVSNWGWSILILTFILNIAMVPTRISMMKKSVAMARIQPQMDAIKAKYAKYKMTDPRRQDMNKEVMELQKREGINMFGGCLPMLLQYPLLIGFYRMLGVSIELRQAHWLWLPDLAAPDPYYILPVFVIVSMFLVQFYMPSPGMDRQQQRMMAFMMPAFFGFMMINIGSGVALYWAGQNILGVLQQVIMNRTSMGREMRALAAKRAAKKRAAPGKVINARR
jgi:YidC/Oxa1 family membrane protein insertase